VRFPYSQAIPTPLPTGPLRAEPYEIASGRAWTELARTLPVRRGQPRRSICSLSVIAGPRNNRNRPANIERIAALFCSMPLTAENVFLRPARLDGSHGEREVCDVLVALRGQGIVLSLKSQDAAAPRERTKLGRWCAKHARKAAGQISGACRAMKMQSFWCQHWRRGRVDFALGSVTHRWRLRHLSRGAAAPTRSRAGRGGSPDVRPLARVHHRDGLPTAVPVAASIEEVGR
jgi:hypothetical protein